jgi:hypothetical protein
MSSSAYNALAKLELANEIGALVVFIRIEYTIKTKKT